MELTPGVKIWAKRIVKAAIVVELVYVILFNSLFQLPLTQSLINKIRPEKFYVSWQNAWTWYPFRVHVTGVFANGQSRSQQWQFETPAVSASIAVVPLIFKRVWIRNVEAQDIAFRLRPRFKEGRDYSAFMPYYPQIDGWEMTAAETKPKKKKRPWHVSVNNIAVSGDHHLWMHHLRQTVMFIDGSEPKVWVSKIRLTYLRK